MNVTVLLRVIDDPELAAGVSGSTLRLDDPALVALGLGLSLARDVPGALLNGAAVGPDAWDMPLQDAVALGLASVTRVWDGGLETADVPATAAAAAAAIPGGPGLLITGPASGDHGTGVLPGAIAELLGWPLLAEVTAVEPGAEGLVARVRGEGGKRRTYGLPASAVIVAARLPAPGLFPPLARRLAARKRPLPEVSPPAVPLVTGASERISLLDYGPARPLTRHLIKPSATANPADRLRQLMSGGMSGRGGQTLDSSGAGGSGGLARQLADILVKEGFLAG